ncbi:MAG: hypothetical protein IKT41_03960 [Clostridia bacterium]|nr:hypothetical protein [Clostridia bacterium]
MENATKALLISAGVIIGVLIVSLFTYMYSRANVLQTRYEINLKTNEKNKINTKFLIYNGREDITAQEILSIANLAKEYQNTQGIVINVSAKDSYNVSLNIDNIEMIKNNSIGTKTDPVTGIVTKYIKRYRATVTIGENGIVNNVTFNEVEE